MRGLPKEDSELKINRVFATRQVTNHMLYRLPKPLYPDFQKQLLLRSWSGLGVTGGSPLDKLNTLVGKVEVFYDVETIFFKITAVYQM